MRRSIIACLLACLALPQLALAQEEPPPPATAEEPAPPAAAEEPSPPPAATQAPGGEPSKPAAAAPRPDETLGHKYQLGFGLRFGSGYRVIAPYQEQFCGETTDTGENKSICGGRQPFWIELSPSFGLTAGLELLADVRVYLEDDFSSSQAWFIAPGIKYYTDPESLFKFFLTGQVVLENQDLEGSGLDSFDVGIRSALGLQFDLLRYLGLYAQGGVTLGFKRWLTFVVDFAGGVQVRY